MSERKYYHISKTGLSYGMKNLDDAVDSMNEGGFIWLDYYETDK